eukprot:SAG22_NODE_13579_length_401_cov_1.192053_1_plen_70_part_00
MHQTDFEAVPFVPAELPVDHVKEHLEFDVEQHHPGFLEKLRLGLLPTAKPMHDEDDDMRRLHRLQARRH